MHQPKSKKKKATKPSRPWRKNPKQWTDTFFEKKLLLNPFLLTNCELAAALAEHQKWRRGEGKYNWQENPIKEHKEDEAPFSPNVLSNLLYEAIARLAIIGDVACGRHKTDVRI